MPGSLRARSSISASADAISSAPAPSSGVTSAKRRDLRQDEVETGGLPLARGHLEAAVAQDAVAQVQRPAGGLAAARRGDGGGDELVQVLVVGEGEAKAGAVAHRLGGTDGDHAGDQRHRPARSVGQRGVDRGVQGRARAGAGAGARD